jgi:hypothetical protein
MNSARSNRRRLLSDLLSIDAWHAPIRVDEKTAKVCVELTFKEGRVGGNDTELPFTFKVSLRKAELTIKLENPLVYDRDTVSRSIPSTKAELTRIRTAREHAERTAKFGMNIDAASFAAAFKAQAGEKTSDQREDVLKVVQTIPEIMVTPSPKGNNSYSWSMEPTWRQFLSGQPWDPSEEPRMLVGLTKVSKIEPAVSVELRCAFEDIAIYELETKETSVFGLIKASAFNVVNEKAAVQYLKKLIAQADLQSSAMDNRFNEIILASVMAMEG